MAKVMERRGEVAEYRHKKHRITHPGRPNDFFRFGMETSRRARKKSGSTFRAGIFR